jgi:hypothetical protein
LPEPKATWQIDRVPTARRCQGCGATLGEAAPGATVVTCQFCGLAHDATVLFPAIHVGQTPQQVRVGSRAVWVITIAVIVIIAASALVPAIMSLRLARDAVSVATTRPSALPGSRPDPRRPIAPADLAGLTQGGGWKVLETPPPPGGFADFDPVAGIPWAMTIARGWASDAALIRVDVGRVAATGAVDLSGEQGSGYRFVSPGRRQRWINETDAGSKSLTATGLMIDIKGSEVRALPHEERQETAPPEPASLPLAELLERARRGRGFEDKPYYAGYLIHLPREGWVWYFRAVSGTSGYPRVRARDGKPYPYR